MMNQDANGLVWNAMLNFTNISYGSFGFVWLTVALRRTDAYADSLLPIATTNSTWCS